MNTEKEFKGNTQIRYVAGRRAHVVEVCQEASAIVLDLWTTSELGAIKILQLYRQSIYDSNKSCVRTIHTKLVGSLPCVHSDSFHQPLLKGCDIKLHSQTNQNYVG